jgi:hypothetical protein
MKNEADEGQQQFTVVLCYAAFISSEQKFDHEFQWDPKPKITVLARASSKLLY